MMDLLKQFFGLSARAFDQLYTIPIFGIFSIWGLAIGLFVVALAIKLFRSIFSGIHWSEAFGTEVKKGKKKE